MTWTVPDLVASLPVELPAQPTWKATASHNDDGGRERGDAPGLEHRSASGSGHVVPARVARANDDHRAAVRFAVRRACRHTAACARRGGGGGGGGVRTRCRRRAAQSGRASRRATCGDGIPARLSRGSLDGRQDVGQAGRRRRSGRRAHDHHVPRPSARSSFASPRRPPPRTHRAGRSRTCGCISPVRGNSHSGHRHRHRHGRIARSSRRTTTGASIASATRRARRHSPRPARRGPNRIPPTGGRRRRSRSARSLQAAASRRTTIAAVGLSGQMHGAVLLDAHGDVVRPAIIWCDQRTDERVRVARRRRSARARLLELTSNPALTNFTLTKLLWVRTHEPKSGARARTCCCRRTTCGFRLSGELRD